MPCIALLALGALSSAPPHTVEIAPNVSMPVVNLGTCCGSDPAVGLGFWVDAGGVGVDTAWSYQNQDTIEQVMASKKIDRSKVFLTTKVPPARYCERASVGMTDCAQHFLKINLRELNVTSIDLVLLHQPSGSDAANIDLWKGLQRAQKDGLARSIGVSNFSPAQLEALKAAGSPQPAVNQCRMSVGFHDDETIAYCKAHSITRLQRESNSQSPAVARRPADQEIDTSRCRYEAFYTMKGCDFSSAVIGAIAANHSVGVPQVCLHSIA